MPPTIRTILRRAMPANYASKVRYNVEKTKKHTLKEAKTNISNVRRKLCKQFCGARLNILKRDTAI